MWSNSVSSSDRSEVKCLIVVFCCSVHLLLLLLCVCGGVNPDGDSAGTDEISGPEIWGGARRPLPLSTITPKITKNKEHDVKTEVSRSRPSPKRFKCGIDLNAGCQCTKNLRAFSIICSKARLTEVPKFDFGPHIVRTLDLKNNHISTLKIGDLFGLKIESLLLAENRLTELDMLAFWGLEFHLETLDLSKNHFVQVPSEALRLLHSLRTLNLVGNRISLLRDDDFNYLHKLEVLHLDRNPISHIEVIWLSLISYRSFPSKHKTFV